MGFFKDFKDDLNETASEINGSAVSESTEDEGLMVNTLDTADTSDASSDPELAKIAADLAADMEDEQADSSFEEAALNVEETLAKEAEIEEETVDTIDTDADDSEESAGVPVSTNEEYSDEIAIITSCLVVTGDLDSDGSIDLLGTVKGNVACKGKLTVSGTIIGDSSAKEIFANSAKIEGNVSATGSIKVGQGTVIVGNIAGTSAVIAGAVKGDIDVHGPVIVDSTAVIVGDIKSKTVQINNGAAIDGRCSQCYADINTDEIFGVFKNK